VECGWHLFGVIALISVRLWDGIGGVPRVAGKAQGAKPRCLFPHGLLGGSVLDHSLLAVTELFFLLKQRFRAGLIGIRTTSQCGFSFADAGRKAALSLEPIALAFLG
jgi:hypothetical protein